MFQATNHILRTTELLVTNLPFEPSIEGMVEARLRALSDNCGGRVGQIRRDNNTREANCVISFASADDADRYVDVTLNSLWSSGDETKSSFSGITPSGKIREKRVLFT